MLQDGRKHIEIIYFLGIEGTHSQTHLVQEVLFVFYILEVDTWRI